MKCTYLLATLLFFGCTFGEASSVFNRQTKIQSLEIGQLLMIGISGTKINSFTKAKIRDLRPGGIILFSKNIKSAQQLAQLTYDLQEFARSIRIPPFFIAIDQEGGSVTRLKSWPPLPSAAALGRAGDVDLAFKTAFFTGQVMQTLGLNMNLAPVLDLGDAYRPTFLGSRAYHHDPFVVQQMGAFALAGYKAAGVVAVAKHYPGHGAADGDSHNSLPSSTLSLENLADTHGRPFETAIASGVLPAVMAAHVSYPKLDPSNLPATFSKAILGDRLRKQLGFKGLVLTDDVEMQGAKKYLSAAKRSVAAIQAGADMVMIAWNRDSQYSAVKGLKAALSGGILSAERIAQSLDRISALKANFIEYELPTNNQLKAMIYHRELYKTIDSIALTNIRSSFHATAELGSNISILTDSPQFLADLGRTIKGSGVHYDMLEGINPFEIKRQLARYPRHVSLFIHAQKKTTLKSLFLLTARERDRIILVSDELPSRIKVSGGFQQAVLSYSKHPAFGRLFGKELLLVLAKQRVPAGVKNENKVRQ